MKNFIAKLFVSRKKLSKLFKEAEDLYRIGNGAKKKDYVLGNIYIPEFLKAEIYDLIQLFFEEISEEINSRTMKIPVKIGRKNVRHN